MHIYITMNCKQNTSSPTMHIESANCHICFFSFFSFPQRTNTNISCSNWKANWKSDFRKIFWYFIFTMLDYTLLTYIISDPNFLQIFLFTYRQFITPKMLIDFLVARYPQQVLKWQQNKYLNNKRYHIPEPTTDLNEEEAENFRKTILVPIRVRYK